MLTKLFKLQTIKVPVISAFLHQRYFFDVLYMYFIHSNFKEGPTQWGDLINIITLSNLLEKET